MKVLARVSPLVRRASGLCLGILLLVCLSAPSARARGWKGADRISGQVVDETGQPVAGLTLKVSEAVLKLRQTLTTDPRGRFELSALVDEGGSRCRLERGQRLKLSAWSPGFEPREFELPYPGGRLKLAPLILPHERLELLTAPSSTAPELLEVPAGPLLPSPVEPRLP